MRHIVIGTAGHVDHGKTTLVRALTGIETDTTAEEKKRGLTINLGFAWLDLPDGTRAGIVDVPGHEKFIKNMVAGLPGLNLVLLVIDANEGVMPQTKEHFDILTLLGVREFIVVVTKADTVSEELLDLALKDIREHLAQTPAAGAPIVVTDALSGRGLDDLVRQIQESAANLPSETADGDGRLNVDRSFSLKGFGTIVTGTLIDGPMLSSRDVWLYPGGRRLRIRNIQVHEEDVLRAEPPQRTALNLAGIACSEIRRGDVLCTAPDLTATRMLDVKVTCLADAAPLVHWQRMRLLIGTREVMVRIVPLGAEQIAPGTEGFLQLRLEADELYVRAGDRFILRTYSPMHTVAGGEILDAHPKKHRRFKADVVEGLKARDAGLIDEVTADYLRLRQVPFTQAQVIAKAVDLPLEKVEAALEHLRSRGIVRRTRQGYIHSQAYKAWQAKVLQLLRAYHQAKPLQPGMPQAEFCRRLGLNEDDGTALLHLLMAGSVCRLSRQCVAAKEFRIAFSPAQRKLQSLIEKTLDRSGFVPTEAASLRSLGKEGPAVVDALNGKSLVFLSPEFVLSKRYFTQAARLAYELLQDGQALRLGQFRDALHINRSQALLILEYMDRCGLTRRVGDGRLAGPKLGKYQTKGGTPHE
ncbi:selenocysteine-specific translation elongation factor [uncultured Megasphaera sp.]|uniref:selenocysteine-specific translation elongation factor n=3 Tax=uncultured Megasphaera sp. TaxID=165188 RepID=UPI0025E4B36D|nr:selenocysteine-specific translation elongation factor [uncultured Megasphaera sp.]